MNAVIYASYSCDNQREESIEGQLRECRAFAERNNYTLIDTYIDRAMSAKTDNRPEFQKMIKDSAKGQFNAIIVWKLDRFAAIVMTAHITKQLCVRMVSGSYLQLRSFPRAHMELFLNRFWKGMRNITQLNFRRRLSVV